MTSQKRYRHHQEGNNNSRFRDLPPRFKRQKSSSSPPAAAQSEEQISETSSHPAAATSQPIKTPPPMSPSGSVVYPTTGNHPVQLRPRTNVLPSPQIPVSSQSALHVPQNVNSKLHVPQNVNNTLVLSPWDSGHFNRVQNTQSHHVPLGTHFGYELNSPPLSPWAAGGTSNLSGQPAATGSPSWMASQSVTYPNQRIHASPVYFDNENWVPSHMSLQSPDAVWGKLPSSPRPNASPSPPTQSLMLPSAKSAVNTKVNEEKIGTTRQGIDYSDPDIRTIEMLRELERVADEKESECDDFGVDRKSLVSHHLRMLMCAVDRYTEGIEDDLAMSSRSDEVTAANDSRGATPKTSPIAGDSWHQNDVKETSKNKSNRDISLWSPSYSTSVWKDSVSKPPASPASNHHDTLTYSLDASFSSLQEPPVMGSRCRESQNTVAWDLWSSPSFDFSGVLSQNSEGLTNDPFGRFGEKGVRERKPLYQR